MSRDRLNIFLEPEHARRLAQLGAMKGVSKSAIVAAAVASYLSPDGGDRREAAIAKRLDKLSRQYERLERDQTILIETVALFVRYTLTVNAPIPAAHQDAARAQGRERFRQFVDQLARHLQKGRSLVADVHEESRSMRRRSCRTCSRRSWSATALSGVPVRPSCWTPAGALHRRRPRRPP